MRSSRWGLVALGTSVHTSDAPYYFSCVRGITASGRSGRSGVALLVPATAVQNSG